MQGIASLSFLAIVSFSGLALAQEQPSSDGEPKQLLHFPKRDTAQVAHEHGQIRICRTPHVVTITDGKPIKIANHSVFVTSPAAMDKEGRYKSITVQTTAAAEIAAAEKCAVVPAVLIENDTSKPVTTQNFYLRMSGEGDLPEVTGYIINDFR